MVVQHNLQAMNSNRLLGITTGTLQKSTEKLSSGYRINRAADNAAGLAISEKMRKQVRGLTQASANAEDGISSVQTAEGALTEIHDMLQRMNELAVQAANGTNASDDRSYIQDEIDQLSQEIDRVAETTKFNETYLLKGDRQAVKGYSFSYKTLTDTAGTDDELAVNATVKEATDAATGIKVTYDFSATTVSSTYQNALAKALRDQGVTVTVTTGSTGANVPVLTLNGSDANATFDVVKSADAANTAGNMFDIKTANGDTVATLTVANYLAANNVIAGTTTANITSDKATAAGVKGEKFALYDKDGNRIAENALGKYFSGAKNTAGTAEAATARADAPSVYDALGNKYVIGSDAFKQIVNAIAANKDQTAALKMSFHVGADGTLNNKINVSLDAMSAKGLGVNGLKVDGKNGDNATQAIDTISAAIKKVSTQRSALGAIQNRLEHTIKNLDNIVENTTAAESAIRDTDMASEMVTYSNNNILAQAGQSMLAQANQANQGVLSLLG